MDELHRQWAANIRIARRALGWTQAELAERLGLTQQSVARWEAAIATPRDEMKLQLASVLHTDVRILFPLVRVGQP